MAYDALQDYTKVRDDCRITGKFRGAAHKHCNMNYAAPEFYAVVLHNLARYDTHLFIKKLGGNIVTQMRNTSPSAKRW